MPVRWTRRSENGRQLLRKRILSFWTWIRSASGAVIPRNTSRYDDAAIILKRFGVTGKRALTPLLPAIGMLGTCTHQGTLVRRDAWAPDEPEPEVPAEDTEDPEIYKQTIRDLKQQIASLMQEQAAADL